MVHAEARGGRPEGVRSRDYAAQGLYPGPAPQGTSYRQDYQRSNSWEAEAARGRGAACREGHGEFEPGGATQQAARTTERPYFPDSTTCPWTICETCHLGGYRRAVCHNPKFPSRVGGKVLN